MQHLLYNIKHGKLKKYLASYCTILALFMIIGSAHQAFGDYSFNSVTNLSNDATAEPSQITISGNNVYVVWEDDSTTNIFFKRSTDGGSTFGSVVNLSNDGTALPFPEVTASGSNVYATWTDSASGNNQVHFIRSVDNGSTFDPVTNLSNDTGNAGNTKLAISGSNAYVVWQDSTPGNNDIFFKRSTDSGSTFGSAVNLSNDSGLSIEPQISISGSNVYVAWRDDSTGNNEIFFKRSTDGGSTFGSVVNLSNNTGASISPQIVSVNNNVYVTWDDFTTGNDEVLYERSTDGGVTFNGALLGHPPGPPVNLSNNGGSSTLPQVAASGSNVYVAWQDSTPGNNDIFFKRSTDGGSTFGSVVNLSNDSGSSTGAHIAISSNNVYVTWRDDSTANNEIFFKSSTDSGTTFSSVNNLSGTSGDSTFVQITVSASNVFVTWIDEGSSPGSAAYDVFFTVGKPTSTNIVFDSSEYKLSSTASISITAPSSNNASVIDSITVNIKSASDPTGITLIFNETGLNTGVFKNSITFTENGASSGTLLHAAPDDTITATFGGTSGFANIFKRTVNFDLAAYLSNSTAIITVTDQNSNLNPAAVESIPVLVTSTHNSGGVIVNLQETGPDTGLFNITSHSSLQVAEGDTITASYKGSVAHAIIIPGTGPGGSSGGPVPPGLVLDAVLFFSKGTSGNTLPPSFSPDGLTTYNPSPLEPLSPSKNSDNAPFSIDTNGYDIFSFTNTIITNTKETGKPIDVKLILYDASSLQHVALYTNLRDDKRDISSADTFIIYEKGEPLQISDPNGLFSNATYTIKEENVKNEVHFHITFAKPMEKSDIIIRSWDEGTHSMDTILRDAWQVIISQQEKDNNQTIPQNNQGSAIEENSKPSSQENSVDTMSAVKEWSGYSPTSISDSQLLESMGIHGSHIPSWFMKTAKWLIDGETSQDEFLNAIKYMHESGLIK